MTKDVIPRFPKGERQYVLQIVLLVVITAGLYWRSLGNEFLMLWDDRWMVFNPYTADGFTLDNIGKILTDVYYRQYSPLNQFLYTLLHSVVGYNPVVYHGFSILLHTLNVVLAYLFLNSLLSAMRGDLRPSVSAESRASITANAAFIGALLFAAHPANVETVSWVSASKIVLCTFFYLLGLYLYVRFIGSRSRTTYITVLLLFALAFGAKEQAVSFVLCCVVIDYAVRRKERLPYLLLEKMPMILLALYFGLLTMITHWQGGPGRMPSYTGFGDRIILASYSAFEYIVKSIIPNNLSYIYPFPYQPGQSIRIQLCIYPVLIVLAGFLVYRFRKNRLVVFAVLFFLANLVLMLHFIPMSRFTIICDRYLYVALLGPASLVGWWGACGIWKRRALTLAILIPYLLYLSAYTFIYQGVWENSFKLKKEVREHLKNREGRLKITILNNLTNKLS